MAVLTRYKDFSSAKEIFRIPAGTTLKEFLPGTDWKSYAVFINGERADENVPLKEKDIVMIRSVPHGVTTAVLIGLAVAGAVAVASAVYAGYQMYQAKKEAQRMQEELEKLKSSTSDGVTNIPTIKGASNTAATGKTQPYIIGRHLFTPYILNAGGGTYKGWHRIAGVNGIDEYYNVVLECGFNKQSIESVYCDDVLVASIESDSPQEGIFHFNSGSAFSGGDSFMEVAQDGEKFDTDSFNTKVVETEPGAEVGKTDDDGYTPLYYTLESNAKACNVVIQFNGLYAVNGEGSTIERTRNIDASWSENYAQLVAEGDTNADADATWRSFPFNQAIWHDPVTTKKIGWYKYSKTIKVSDYTDDVEENADGEEYVVYSAKQKAYAAAKSALYGYKLQSKKWTFREGEDIRSELGKGCEIKILGGYSIHTNARHWSTHHGDSDHYEVLSYDFTMYIRLRKTTWTAGYYESRNSSTFTYAKKTQMRFAASADIPFSYRFDTSTDDSGNTVYTKKRYPITVRIKTTDPAYTGSGSAVDSCYVKYVQSVCFNEKKSSEAGSYVDERVIDDREAKVSTVLGIRIKATSSNEDKLGKISIVTNGLARTWDSSTKSWSADKEATSNVAAWVLEILTSDTHAPSKAEDEEIDLESFGEWYEYCDKYGLNVNKVLTQGATKESVLNDIVPLGRGALYMSIYGKIAAAFDAPGAEPVALFNEQNLRSFTYEKELGRQPDGVKVTFTDASAGFEENSIIEMYDGSDADDRGNDCAITEINGAGVTSQYEAWQLAHYTMNCARLRPRTAKAKIGKEGIYLAPYSKVLIQHSSLKIGLGNAEVKATIEDASGNIAGLELYDALDITATDEFYVSVQCVSGASVSVVTKKLAHADASGRTKEIYFDTPIPSSAAMKPKQGDVLSYGTGENTVTEPFLITGAEPDADGYTLTLVDYSPKIFDFGSVPVFESPLSDSYTPADSGTVPDAQQTELVAKIYDMKYDTVHSGATPATPEAKASAGRDGITFTCSAGGTSLYNTVKSFTAVLYKGADDTDGTEITSDDGRFTYEFDRSKDGYPEAAALSGWTFKAKATSVYGLDSEWTETAAVDTSSYGTWKFSFTTSSVTSDVNCRTVILSFAPEKMAGDTKTLYGDIRYRVSVSRAGFVIDGDTGEETSESIADTDSDGNTVYYAPNLSASPYPSGTTAGGDYKGNEDAYKDTSSADGYITSGSRFSQTLPLYGQEKYSKSGGEWAETGKKIQNTAYIYRITAVNESGEEHTVSGYAVTALCTAIQDLVYSHSYYKNLYVEKLSAINANIGLISQGGFGDFSGWNNFWALSYLTAEASGVAGGIKAGAFKVGDANQYIMVIPPGMTFGSGADAVENDSETGFMVRIKAGNITLTSTGTEFESGTYIKDDLDKTKRMHLTAGGIEIEKYEDGGWTVRARVTSDTAGNMFITNTPAGTEGLPEFGTPLTSPSSIYHLEGGTLDTNGGNAGSFTFSAESWPSSTLVNSCSKLMKGSAEKSLAAEDVCLFTDTDIYIGNTMVDIEAGSASDAAAAWNTKLGVTCFVQD